MTLATFVQASAHDLHMIAAGCVQAIVTSPPYYGLRAYAGEQSIEWPAVEYAPMPGLAVLNVPAMRASLGNEPTLEAYIGHLILCLREWRRVLRDDGICFVNLGDSFSGSGGAGGDYNEGGLRAGQPKFKAGKSNGLKPKDLMMVPARFALAAQADGWWLRSDIIGHKIAPMPESVTDRPTRSHEHIFMLTKSARYYWDGEAVKETAVKGAAGSTFTNGKTGVNGMGRVSQLPRVDDPTSRNMRDVIEWRPSPFPGAHFAVWPEAIPEKLIRAATSDRGCCAHCGKPWVRQVEFERTDYKAITYATTAANGVQSGGVGKNFPKTVKTGETWAPSCRCGSPDGADYRPDDFDIIFTPTGERVGDDPTMLTGRGGLNRPRGENEGSRPITRYEQRKYAEQLKASPYRAEMEYEAGSAFAHYLRTDNSGARPIPPLLLEKWISNGWLKWVDMPQRIFPEPMPCIVLDPFSGSGTTAKVAVRLGRRAIGIDICAEYLDDITALRFGEGVQMELTGL